MAGGEIHRTQDCMPDESRRWVIRSANTIDPYGRILQAQPWEKEAVIKQSIPARDDLTIYVRFGDWVSRIMIALAVVLIGYSYYTLFVNRKTKNAGL